MSPISTLKLRLSKASILLNTPILQILMKVHIMLTVVIVQTKHITV